MLRHALPGHVQVLAELTECLTVVRVQLVEQLAAAGIGQGPEQCVGVGAFRHVLYASVDLRE
jgi:hypothetical protein